MTQLSTGLCVAMLTFMGVSCLLCDVSPRGRGMWLFTGGVCLFSAGVVCCIELWKMKL